MASSKTSPQHLRPLLSIITVFWNSGDEIHRYFESLEACRNDEHFELEVIAVDNHSADGTADAIAKDYPWVTVVRNSDNLGFAEGCNTGLRVATGDFLLLLNPDCETSPKALAHLVSMASRHPSIGAVGCKLLHTDGLPQKSFYHEPSWWSYLSTHSLVSPKFQTVKKRVNTSHFGKKPLEVDWLMGACILVRRSVLEEVGELDGEYFMYAEDSDWCRRIRTAGFAVVYDPRVSMYHHQGTTARRRAEFTFKRLYKSQLRYTKKHHGSLESLALRTTIMLDLLVRLPIYRLAGETERIKSTRSVLRGYFKNNPELIK